LTSHCLYYSLRLDQRVGINIPLGALLSTNLAFWHGVSQFTLVLYRGPSLSFKFCFYSTKSARLTENRKEKKSKEKKKGGGGEGKEEEEEEKEKEKEKKNLPRVKTSPLLENV